MDTVNLVVMGKTGAGKSTLINAVLGEDRAPTDIGRPVTKENTVYKKSVQIALQSEDGKYRTVWKNLVLYDTVGLEIDELITQKTLEETRNFIQRAQLNEDSDDMSMVWFCVNSRGCRLEPFELDLIRELSIEYEIPFFIVLTQCIEEEGGPLEKQLRQDLPEVNMRRILARDYRFRGGAVVRQFGVSELLQDSITFYNQGKVRILENKLERLKARNYVRISEIKAAGEACINRYEEKAGRIGIIPVACIPFVHSLCESMIKELNQIAGVKRPKDSSTIRIVHTLVGTVVTPFMAVPFISAATASAYVGTVGNQYWEAFLSVMKQSSDEEMRNNALMARRIEWEIKNRRKNA